MFQTTYQLWGPYGIFAYLWFPALPGHPGHLAPMLALPQAVDGCVHGHRTTAEIEVSKLHEETQGDPRKNPELYW